MENIKTDRKRTRNININWKRGWARSKIMRMCDLQSKSDCSVTGLRTCPGSQMYSAEPEEKLTDTTALSTNCSSGQLGLTLPSSENTEALWKARRRMGRKDADRKEAGHTRRCLREARTAGRGGGHLGLKDGSAPDYLGALNTVRQDIKLPTHPFHPEGWLINRI